MKNPFEGKVIWFLTGSQGLYGPETLEQVADQSKEIVAALNDSADIPVDIEWRPTLTDEQSIFRAMADASADDSVIGVITWMHTFSPARMWIRGLDALHKPLLHLHTQHHLEIPWDTIDMDFMNLNQAAHGDREFGYILTRMGVPRVSVVGHVTDERVPQRIGVWMRAAAGWNEAQNMRMVRFGDNMRNVAVTEGDKTEAAIRFGATVNTWSVNELVEAVDAISEERVDALIKEYQDLYEFDPVLDLGGEKHQSLRYAAKQEAALRDFLEAEGATAFTDTFEDLGGLKQLPGFAVQRLMADGYGFGAEGDWKTGVLIRIAKVMGYGLPGGASLMEDYSYNMAPGNKKILGAHMLEICPSLTEKKPRLEIHPLGIGDREDPVRLVFDTDPGDATVVALSDLRDRFRLTANVVKVVEPDKPLPKLPVARAVWEPAPDLVTSATCWLASGAAHHTVMSTALPLDAWRDFARIAQMELAVIDEDTTVEGFEEELRWNNVYYRVAQGF
ncbi:L-arabinose isomerase [Corynebacterium phoceense]|uniref:L-arabinose isomerase n=1 Tax=Corynebacterium phoceense TaxID=1686286 RepID=UPI00211C834A|nr:L-arabinose isomerase [Corynebacterium phoceense]MCQ9345836.1 L-arabinose isomerase [Corynebacterium phoceense]MCQ9347776.1 L-arabinose isomerase [Corynebacterium phoceense]